MSVDYSPTQLKLLNVLGDGEHHTKKELQIKCFGEENGKSNTLPVHLSLLRKKLAKDSKNGHLINIIPIHEAEEVTYQLVKIIPATVNDVKSFKRGLRRQSPLQ